MPREIPYPHPCEILLEEFLKPLGVSQYRLAKEIGVPKETHQRNRCGQKSCEPPPTFIKETP